MRAELASIEPPTERRRFAIVCSVSAIGIDARHWLLPVAIGTGVCFAVGTLAASRASLVAAAASWVSHSRCQSSCVHGDVRDSIDHLIPHRSRGRVDRSACRPDWHAGASIVEAAHWFDVAGVYLLDGDNPREGLDRLGAVLDPVAPTFVFFHLSFWAPWAVLGAAAGSMRLIAQRTKPRLQRR
jgi:hypothetical protein